MPLGPFTAKMGNFLRDHNYKATKHVSTNLILATMVLMISVFAYGFENSVLSTVQAMNGKKPPETAIEETAAD